MLVPRLDCRLSAACVLGALALAAGCSSGGDGGGGTPPGGPVPLTGPQTATLSIELATGAVTVTQAAQALVLGGSASFDSVANEVDLALNLKNNSTSVLHNPKALVLDLSQGALGGDGVFDAGGVLVPYVYYGPRSLASLAEATRDFHFTGVSASTATLEVELEFVFHPWLFTNGEFGPVPGQDSSGTGKGTTIDVAALGFFGAFLTHQTQFQPALVSADTRFVYLTCRNQPIVAALDTTAMNAVVAADLSGGGFATDGLGAVGSVDGLSRSPDGELVYAVLNRTHTYRYQQTYPPGDVDLLALDAQSLAVVASVTVHSAADNALPDGSADGSFLEYRGRRLSLSADGSVGAVALTALGQVALVDLVDMELVQTFNVPHAEPRFAAVSPDGSAIYVAYASNATPADGTLDRIDVATGGITPIVPPTLDVTNHVGDLRFGPDGRLYYGRNFTSVPGLSIYDPALDLWVEHQDVSGCFGVAFSADGSRYYVYDQPAGLLRGFETATDAPAGFVAAGETSLANPGGGPGHGIVLTE